MATPKEMLEYAIKHMPKRVIKGKNSDGEGGYCTIGWLWKVAELFNYSGYFQVAYVYQFSSMTPLDLVEENDRTFWLFRRRRMRNRLRALLAEMP